MELKEKGILAPQGFMAAGAHIGIKKAKKDLAIIYSETPCTYAGAFTLNQVKAAPVIWDQLVLANKTKVHGVVVNSGNANAVTGELGDKNTERMAQVLAESVGKEEQEILVCSTGVIGVQLPMDVIEEGIKAVAPQLEASKKAATDAAEAILTTDTFIKEIAIKEQIGETTIYVGGIGKGSGMIHPNMATMLGFVTTDVNISQEMLQKALSECVNTTFNMITVDGDTSTNDTVLVLANGKANNPLIAEEGPAYETFKSVLKEVLKYIAISIVKDGEGATKLLEVEVQQVASFERGKSLAKSILTSSLVKTAFFGEDANWGRILAAMGYAGVPFDSKKVTLQIESGMGKIMMFRYGDPIKFNENKAKTILEEKEIKIIVDMNEGTQKVNAWGCDLSYDYVKINGEYRS